MPGDSHCIVQLAAPANMPTFVALPMAGEPRPNGATSVSKTCANTGCTGFLLPQNGGIVHTVQNQSSRYSLPGVRRRRGPTFGGSRWGPRNDLWLQQGNPLPALREIPTQPNPTLSQTHPPTPRSLSFKSLCLCYAKWADESNLRCIMHEPRYMRTCDAGKGFGTIHCRSPTAER